VLKKIQLESFCHCRTKRSAPQILKIPGVFWNGQVAVLFNGVYYKAAMTCRKNPFDERLGDGILFIGQKSLGKILYTFYYVFFQVFIRAKLCVVTQISLHVYQIKKL
jgi:hypothetical protein